MILELEYGFWSHRVTSMPTHPGTLIRVPANIPISMQYNLRLAP